MKITAFKLATFKLPEGHPEFPGEDEIHAFLIEHPDGPVLVDTGFGEDNDYIEKTFAPRRMNLVAELKALGVEPLDISIVINSHLHFDHCGNNRLFPHARFFMTGAELEDARGKRYTVRSWFDFEGADLNAINEITEILPGITLLPTPGHTRGHLSVVVSGETTKVIAAQAIYTHTECVDVMSGGGQIQNGNWNDDAYRASRQSIFDLKPERIYFSHDHIVWEQT